MITIYGIRNCDTMKKAFDWLNAHQIEYQFHDYKKQGAPLELIEEFMTHFELDNLINRRGTTWRKLPDSTKEQLTEPIAKELMSGQPSLIKRPVINCNNQWLIGFNPEQLASACLNNH